MKQSLLFILLALPVLLSASKPMRSFWSVYPKKGEIPKTLLKRYKLPNKADDLKDWCRLNSVNDSNKKLTVSKKYKIPVYKIAFNGKNIRTSLGIDNLQTAKQIQAYNEMLDNNKLISDDYKSSGYLMVPRHLMEDVEVFDVPAKADKTADETPAAGKGNVYLGKNVILNQSSNRLSGKVYYIKSGHGGPDPGAIYKKGKTCMCEDEYAYDVSLRLYKILKEQGAKVYMVVMDPNDGIRSEEYLKCDQDEVTFPNKKIPINQLARLKSRMETINSLYVKNKKAGYKDQVFVSLHVDSRNKGHRQDVFFYYKDGSKKGKEIAENMHQTFKNKYDLYRGKNLYKGTVTTRSLYVLNNSAPPAVFVELANIKNPDDQKRLVYEENRQALAKWLAEGLTGKEVETAGTH